MAFKELMDIRWLYQGFVITTVLIGLVGIWATIRLIRGGPDVFRNAMIILVIGTLIGGIHYFTSLTMRGKAAPANVKFYLNIITLVIFLLYYIPGIRDRVDFSERRGNSKAEKAASAGMVSIVAGVITVTVFQWAAPSHTLNGENWVYVFYTPLMVSGTLLLAGGLGALTWGIRELFKQEITQNSMEFSEIHQ
ncbi:MAG: hypothetical protein GWO08_19865 [Gammaproteobacteria bacterium]|nr:hypothetical protein [candidate division Zixibacteria bacterium]NIR95806.1 hypothetical protein [Gammaproteobacteria bacterium]NIR66974.1 hypothetical protein [candidate division Zixibacteria bacterium]NIS48420.1 hypothetical protein [candidate division Zixibacteria bacterium]NIU16539.1 hypothetical protein [candidate division Zixibacteria bacterium]